MELRFTTEKTGSALSPISLRFDSGSNLTLRFDAPWPNASSPIRLRFSDGEVTPPLPFDNTIGIECAVCWVKPSEPESKLIIAERAHNLGTVFDSQWLTNLSETMTVSSCWSSSQSMGVSYSLPWLFNVQTRIDLVFGYSLLDEHHYQAGIEWLSSSLLHRNVSLDWFDIVAHQSFQKISWRDGDNRSCLLTISYRGLICDGENSITWGPHVARWICSTNYLPPENGHVTLRFSEPWSHSTNPLVLRFKPSPKHCYFDDGGGALDAYPVLPTLDLTIPIEPQIRRSYLMRPQVNCTRVSDGMSVVLKSVSISQSRTQWTSSGNITFSSRIDAERAANELLRIEINGYDFYLLCESPTESKAFGQSSYSASGRGRLAELSAPYVKPINYVNAQARSFMGLMGDIIENMGWTLASEITDYNVPANAFSYAAKTPAEALNMMASSIGAMLNINDSTKMITVIPQWPTVPWDTENAVADVILHDGVILAFSEKREIRTDANAVFVRGEQQGVAVKVKRTGSAGDNFAGDIVDKLITDNQAARMRATTELANAGNKVQNSIRTKVMADLPPMRPGMLVGVRKGTEVFKSVCDAFTVSASVNDSTGVVTVDQSVTLLRNEEAA
ncbi:hypothetical protein [Shewanella woodyi]|uniref:hypothetical protein n=1 Tax=Shewanella woodyi TaxID=60961 RepID=UPI000A552DB3|nr:hypothetical protein [Shewanella woodyi]